MANLIVTVIAIALVAIASLMGAYYGGSAYMNNQAFANASTVMNSAYQIAGAWNAYRADNVYAVPTALADLLNGNLVAGGSYLQTIPIAPRAPGNVASYPFFIASFGNGYYLYADLGTPSPATGPGINDPNSTECIRVLRTASGGTPPTAIGAAGQGGIAALGNGTYGCGVLIGNITGGLTDAPAPPGADLATGDYVFEYVLQ